MTTLSVIVPAYNEEGNIQRLIERVEKSLKGVDHQLIIVDDGSYDKTAEVAGKYAEIYPVKVVRHSKNKGKVEALKTGLRHADGKYVVFLDADLEYPPDAIPQMLNLAIQGHDIVLAQRIDPRPPHRKIISIGARILAKLLIPQARRLKDPTTEMAVIARELADPDLLKHKYIKPLLAFIIRARNPSEIAIKLSIRDVGKSSFSTNWIINYLYELGDLTNWFTVKYIIVALAVGMVAGLASPYLGIWSLTVSILGRWALLKRYIGLPQLTIAEVSSVVVKMAINIMPIAWFIKALVELLLVHLLRK